MIPLFPGLPRVSEVVKGKKYLWTEDLHTFETVTATEVVQLSTHFVELKPNVEFPMLDSRDKCHVNLAFFDQLQQL